METFSALLAICAGNSPVPGEFPAKMPVTRSFDVFFDLHPNKRLSKQWRGWWFETLSCPLWRHRNAQRLTGLAWNDPRLLVYIKVQRVSEFVLHLMSTTHWQYATQQLRTAGQLQHLEDSAEQLTPSGIINLWTTGYFFFQNLIWFSNVVLYRCSISL